MQKRQAEGIPCVHLLRACWDQYNLAVVDGGKQSRHDINSIETQNQLIHSMFKVSEFVEAWKKCPLPVTPQADMLVAQADCLPPSNSRSRTPGGQRTARFTSTGERAMGKKGGVNPPAKSSEGQGVSLREAMTVISSTFE